MTKTTGAKSSVGRLEGEASLPTGHLRGAGTGGRYPKRLERWTHVSICRCGYATPITTKATARREMDRHVCKQKNQEVLALPEPVVTAVRQYREMRAQRRPEPIDPAVVLRYADGELCLRLSPHERFAVWVLLQLRGWSRTRCAEFLHLSWATQARYRRSLEGVA